MAKQKTAPEAEDRQAIAKRRFYFLIAMLLLIVVFAVASLVIWITMPKLGPDGRPVATDGMFSVKAVTLEGNTVYREDAVVYASGVVNGQSIFTVNAKQIEQTLLQTFPYYSSVEVKTLGMKEVKITVTETPIIGVVYANGEWVSVGANGKALSTQKIISDTPKGILYIKGASAPEGGVVLGGMAMDDYALSIVNTLLTAFDQYNLTEIVEIDLTDLSDLRMNWRGQIEIKLGNASNLTHEIGVVASTIPRLIDSRGEHVAGVLNVSSYSNESLEEQAVFTPSSILPPETEPTRRPADDDNGGTQTADPEGE